VNTIEELKQQAVNKFHGQICGLRKKMKLEIKNPTVDQVKAWIEG